MLELEPHIPLPPWSFWCILLPGTAYHGSVKPYESSLKSKLRCLALEQSCGTWVANSVIASASRRHICDPRTWEAKTGWLWDGGSVSYKNIKKTKCPVGKMASQRPLGQSLVPTSQSNILINDHIYRWLWKPGIKDNISTQWEERSFYRDLVLFNFQGPGCIAIAPSSTSESGKPRVEAFSITEKVFCSMESVSR